MRPADRSFDVSRDEAAVLEANDLRTDTEVGGTEGGLVLVISVDAQQLGVRPADPQYEQLAAHRDLEVVIRDASTEWLDGDVGTRPEPFRKLPDVHGQRS